MKYGENGARPARGFIVPLVDSTQVCVVGLYPFIGLILLNQFNKTEKIHRKIHRKIHIESFRGKPFFDKVTDTLINSKVEFSRVVTN